MCVAFSPPRLNTVVTPYAAYVFRSRSGLLTWPCALINPGITVFPFSGIRCASAGIVTLDAAPAATIRPSRTTIVAFGIGVRFVPSISRRPVKALTERSCAFMFEVTGIATSAANGIRRIIFFTVSPQPTLCDLFGLHHALDDIAVNDADVIHLSVYAGG